MDTQQLEIKDIQKILGWSYPTAYAFAKKYGSQQVDDRQKWLVPAGCIDHEIQQLEREVAKMRRAYSIALLGE